jgi:hypothetical protein
MSVKKEQDKLTVKIWVGNHIYIYHGDNDRLYVLTSVGTDIVWNAFGGGQNAE